MAGHRIIVRDQEGDYIPVSYQFAGADGAALDPSAASLIVYATDSGGATWPTAGITGSPFTLAKIASKTGWYGARISKAVLPVGRYNFRVEATVDGVSAALVERVDVLESGDFAADVSPLAQETTAQSIISEVDQLLLTATNVQFVPETSTVTTGTVQAGTLADAQTHNEAYYVIRAATGVIDVAFDFDIGTRRLPVSATVHGRLVDGSAPLDDILDAYAWNYSTPGWEHISPPGGDFEHSTSDQIKTYNLNQNHIDAATGTVRLRLAGTGLSTGTDIFLDWIYIAAANDLSSLASSTALTVVDGIVDAIKAKTDALPADPAGVSELTARTKPAADYFDPAADSVDVGSVAGTSVAGPSDLRADLAPLEARLTANRAGYLDKLNVGLNTLANTGNADLFKASGFSTLTASQVWGHATRDLTEPVETDAASRTASQADLTDLMAHMATLLARLSAARAVYLDKLNVAGVLAHSADSGRYQADLSAVALEATVQTALDVLDKVDSMLEMPSTDWRFLASALEEAPTSSGTGASAAEVWAYGSRQLTAGPKDTEIDGIATDTDALLARLTTTRAGLMDHLAKLDVSGEIAHTDNAELFKAGAAFGSRVLTVTAQDSLGNPAADVDVTVRAGGAVVTTERTDETGQATIPINDGTYTLYLRRFGWSFPDTDVTITADTALTIAGSDNALTIPAPASADDCRVYEWLRWINASDDPPETVTAAAVIYAPAYADENAIYYAKSVPGVYDPATGLLYWDVVPGANIHFSVTEYGLSTVRAIPDGVTTARLTDLVEIEAEDI